MKEIIKSIIVDDVDSMRVVLKKLLKNFERIEVIGEAADFEDALDLINEEKPDLIFLDIDLNGLTSIDLLKKLNYQPMIIFITSHADFAIQAFEVNAVDFLLKPLSLERLTMGIEKVTNKWEIQNDINSSSAATRIGDQHHFGPDHIILLSFDTKLSFVRVKEISHIEAFGNYTKIYMNDGRLSVTYNSIKNWATRLPEDIFIQIHRSTIINLANVSKIEKWTNDTGRLYMGTDNTPYEISRNYFFELKKKFKM